MNAMAFISLLCTVLCAYWAVKGIEWRRPFYTTFCVFGTLLNLVAFVAQVVFA